MENITILLFTGISTLSTTFATYFSIWLYKNNKASKKMKIISNLLSSVISEIKIIRQEIMWEGKKEIEKKYNVNFNNKYKVNSKDGKNLLSAALEYYWTRDSIYQKKEKYIEYYYNFLEPHFLKLIDFINAESYTTSLYFFRTWKKYDKAGLKLLKEYIMQYKYFIFSGKSNGVLAFDALEGILSMEYFYKGNSSNKKLFFKKMKGLNLSKTDDEKNINSDLPFSWILLKKIGAAAHQGIIEKKRYVFSRDEKSIISKLHILGIENIQPFIETADKIIIKRKKGGDEITIFNWENYNYTFSLKKEGETRGNKINERRAFELMKEWK